MSECRFKCGCPGYEAVADRTSDTLCYDGEIMLVSEIVLPRIRTLGARINYLKINAYYQNIAAVLRNRARLEDYPEAVDRYIASQEAGEVFVPSSVSVSFEAPLIARDLLSVWYDERVCTGIGQCTLNRRARTWQTASGERLALDELFKPACRWREALISQILRIASGEEYADILTENYETLIRNTFNPENFWLDCENIVLFWQPGVLAAELQGIVSFAIPVCRLRYCINGCLLECRDTCDDGCACYGCANTNCTGGCGCGNTNCTGSCGCGNTNCTGSCGCGNANCTGGCGCEPPFSLPPLYQ